LLVPSEDTERTESSPLAGATVADLEHKADFAGLRVLQHPCAIDLLLGSEQIDRFVHPPVGSIPDRAEVFEARSTSHFQRVGNENCSQAGSTIFAGCFTP